MGDPRELEWAKKPDALKESWTARIGTHMVHGVSPYTHYDGQISQKAVGSPTHRPEPSH
jgi:hypothetical protein